MLLSLTCGFVWGAHSKFRPFAGLFQLFFSPVQFVSPVFFHTAAELARRVWQLAPLQLLRVCAASAGNIVPAAPELRMGKSRPPSSATEVITQTGIVTYTDATTRMWSLSNCSQSCEPFFMVTSKLPVISACQTSGACRWVQNGAAPNKNDTGSQCFVLFSDTSVFLLIVECFLKYSQIVVCFWLISIVLIWYEQYDMI